MVETQPKQHAPPPANLIAQTGLRDFAGAHDEVVADQRSRRVERPSAYYRSVNAPTMTRVQAFGSAHGRDIAVLPMSARLRPCHLAPRPPPQVVAQGSHLSGRGWAISRWCFRVQPCESVLKGAARRWSAVEKRPAPPKASEARKRPPRHSAFRQTSGLATGLSRLP